MSNEANDADMTANVMNALRDAVNIARNEQVPSVKKLRRRLVEEGHDPEDADGALDYWRAYENRKTTEPDGLISQPRA